MPPAPTIRFPLDGPWTFHAAESKTSHPATVPGCVHDDLIANSLIPDPYFGENENALQWIGETEWVYERTFEIADTLVSAPHVVLRCEGLDTLATVEINGQLAGKADNMFRTWEWNVRSLLRTGTNSIRICFAPVLPLIREKQTERPMYSWNAKGGVAYWGAAYVRKMACNFGWDWGPKLVSAGIWKPVSLVAWSKGRIIDAHIRQHHPVGGGPVFLEVTPQVDGADSVRVTVKEQESSTPVAPPLSAPSGSPIRVEIPSPRLWWPNGMGGQPLYHVLVESLDGRGQVLDRREWRIGLRTIELQRHPDAWGESFQFAVNGIPFFAKGANWIPTDPFPSSQKPERLRTLLKAAAAAHMNMIRVWGGGVYAGEDLLDVCDELGLLVWQDFMFACSTYPTYDPAFLDNVAEEARDAIRRIRHRACLALWCGNNELEQGLVADHWSPTTMSWEDYGRLFDRLLPDVVGELDPDTVYWPSSPHSPKERKNFNSPGEGDAHLWEVWFSDAPFESYRACGHRFNSEFGFQSFPELATVAAFARPADWNISGPVFEHHQRSGPGNARIFQKIMDWFRVPKDFPSTLALSQIVQALAITYGVEHWRRSMPRGMGTLYWQLNDNWPCASWSSIDSFGRWKALHYAARRFFAPLHLSALEERGTTTVHITSDLLEDVRGTVYWTITDLAGTVLSTGHHDVDCPARSSGKAFELCPDPAGPDRRSLLIWLALESGGRRVSETVVIHDRPRRLEWLDPRISTVWSEESGMVSATLSVEAPALWVWLELADTVFSDNYFALRPGESKTITFPMPPHLDLARLKELVQVRSLVDTYR